MFYLADFIINSFNYYYYYYLSKFISILIIYVVLQIFSLHASPQLVIIL